MKKLIALLFALCMLLTACSSPKEPADTSNVSTTDTTQEAVQSDAAQDAEDTPAGEEDTADDPAAQATASPFETFQAALDEAGYTYEVVTMGAELVGAAAGEKYKFDFGTVELYQFDEGSAALEQAVADGGLTLEGIGVLPCEFNGNLAALINVTENSDTILNIFQSLQ